MACDYVVVVVAVLVGFHAVARRGCSVLWTDTIGARVYNRGGAVSQCRVVRDTWISFPGRVVLKGRDFFLLRTALKDRPKGPPTANSHQLPTATNRQPPTAANRQRRPTANCQPLPTASNHQPLATNHHQPPPTASCQLPTANRRQPPTATNHG